MEARFGPAGNAVAFSERYQSSLDAPAWIAGLGLDCYEYQCGKGVRIGQDTAEKLGERARQAGISLSLHAPYFISLSNPDPEMRRLPGRPVDGGRPGSAPHRGPAQAHPAAGPGHRQGDFAPGHGRLRRPGFWGHHPVPRDHGQDQPAGRPGRGAGAVPAGRAADDGAEVFARMLDKVESALGEERAGRFHSHFSRIEFTPKGGEKCHRTFADHGGFGPDWGPLAAEVARRGWSPTFICESAGTQAEDARTMKEIYQAQRALYSSQ